MMSLLAQGSRNWRAMKRVVNVVVLQVALARHGQDLYETV